MLNIYCKTAKFRFSAICHFILVLSASIAIISVSSCNGVSTRLDNAVKRVPIPNDFQLANQGYFKPERLHLVHQIENNLLFRGSLPIKDGEFVYDELINTMREVAQRDHIDFPTTHKLIIFTFINDKTELADLNIERNWVAANSDKATLIEMPVYGSLIDPNSVNIEIRRRFSENFNKLDDLPQRIDAIHSKLTTPSTEAKIIYIHCEAGVDRTGEVAGSYSMRYQQLSFNEAMEVNTQIAGRNVSRFSKYGMQWYGYYLQQLGITTVGKL